MDDRYFMQKAIDKAREGMKKGQTPFGACIVKDGKIIACEHNVVWQNTDITAHGEIHAIRKACKKLDSIDLSGCTIYSTTEPCPMCFSAIHWANIDRIVFGATIEDAQKGGFSELTISDRTMKKLGNSKVKITTNCMRKENNLLWNEWNSRKRKTY